MRGTMALALGIVAGFPDQTAQKQKTVRVVLIRNERVWIDETKLNPEIVQQMLDEGVMKLTGEPDPVDAFRRFVKPGDIVGIKTNVWQMLPTPPELERAIQRRVLDAGVSKNNVAIEDRGLLSNELFMKATALINVRPMRTHYWAGVGGCLKNLITFTATPSAYHEDNCADIGAFWKLPVIAGKVRLNILSMLNPLFHGRGPHHFDQRYVWNYNGILVGTDPVAVDAVGLSIIKAKRLQFFGAERALQTPPKHITMADVRHGLGTSDLTKIDLIKLGWTKDILV